MVEVTPLILFSIGLLGGAHCIGMCGPLVMLYSRGMEDRGGAFLARQHVLLNLGRVTIYTILGGVFGLAGGVIGGVSFWGKLNAYVAVVIGVFIILFGIRYLLPEVYSALRVQQVLRRISPGGETSFAAGLMLKFRRLANGPSIFFLGFIHGFLPCPIIIPPLLFAFTTGSAATGVYTMALIGLGTFPAMFLFGYGHKKMGIEQRVWMMRAMGALLIILGLIPLLHGLKMLGVVDYMIHIPVFQPFNHG